MKKIAEDVYNESVEEFGGPFSLFFKHEIGEGYTSFTNFLPQKYIYLVSSLSRPFCSEECFEAFNGYFDIITSKHQDNIFWNDVQVIIGLSFE